MSVELTLANALDLVADFVTRKSALLTTIEASREEIADIDRTLNALRLAARSPDPVDEWRRFLQAGTQAPQPPAAPPKALAPPAGPPAPPSARTLRGRNYGAATHKHALLELMRSEPGRVWKVQEVADRYPQASREVVATLLCEMHAERSVKRITRGNYRA